MPLSAETLQPLQQLLDDLEAALAKGDVEAFENLDLRCNQLLPPLMEKAGADDYPLRDLLKQLQALYQRMTTTCTAKRQEALEQIRQMHQGQKGVQAYQSSSRAR